MDAVPVVRVALLHGIPEKWNLDANFAYFRDGLELASGHSPDFFVTPECWLDGYAAASKTSTREQLRTVAQELNKSVYLRQVSDLAQHYGCYLCFGFSLLDNEDIYNAAGLWTSDGSLVGIYHKTHLQHHDLQFSPGKRIPVWDTPWGTIGIMICADRRWPETARVLRLQGARLILNPSYGSYNDLNEAMMRTRAFENQCFIAFCHPRLSLVTGPHGNIVAREVSDKLGVLVADLDLSLAKNDNHLADRRPELYSIITQQVIL